MSEMTSKERIVAALTGKPVDRIPWSPFLAYVWENFPAEIQDMGQPAFLKEVGADPMWRGAPCPVTQTQTGVEITNQTDGDIGITIIETPVGSIRCSAKYTAAGNTSFLVEHLVKTEEDLKVILWIEENTHFELTDQTSVRETLALDGLAVGMLIPRGKTAFQSMIEHSVGTEEMAYMLADHPDTVETLVKTMIEKDLEAVRLAAESDYEYFITWEDSSTQNYSPAMYDRFIAPEIKGYCDILAAHGKHYIQHACGHVKGLLKSMKDSGVAAVESISTQPTGNVTLREAREIIGGDMGIVGGIEPTMFLNLSPRQLEPYVYDVIDSCQGGPFVLANSDSCPPGVTMEKFKIVGRIVREAAGR